MSVPRPSSFFGFIFTAIAVSIQITASSKGVVYAGRTLLGIANGLYVSATILYIDEVAPPKLRGAMVMMYIFPLGCGRLSGSGFIYAFRNYPSCSDYQIPLGVLYVIPTFLFIFTYFPRLPSDEVFSFQNHRDG
jgi:MFS family permease